MRDIIVKLPPPINNVDPINYVDPIRTTNKNINEDKPKNTLKYLIGFLILLVVLFVGYNEIEKSRIEDRLREQEALETQRRIEEAEQKRQAKLNELNNIYENTLAKLRLEKENLEEIKKFKLLRTAYEKEEQIENQLKVIRKLEIQLERIQAELNSL